MYAVTLDAADHHTGSAAVTTGDDHLIPTLCTHDTHEMMCVPARDLNFLRERPRIEQPAHQGSSSAVRRMIIAAHSFSQVMSRTV